MKKLPVFFLLLLHVNYFMFLPQGPEKDTYDAKGQQKDDINSLVEYIRVTLGYDKTADDEDDDNGNNLVLVKICDYIFSRQPFQLLEEMAKLQQTEIKTAYPSLEESFLHDTYIEVATPPPDSIS